MNLVENSLKDTPLSLRFNPSKKRYFLALTSDFYDFLAEQELIKSIYSKSILATIACILLEMETGSVTLAKLNEIRGKTVLEHLKILEKDGLIILKDEKVVPTDKLLIKIDVKKIIKNLKQ